MKSWERLGLFFIAIIMVVSTLSTAIASQQAAKAAKNTDLIAECTTPGTRCYELQIEEKVRTTAENKCIIDSIVNLPPPPRTHLREEILDAYDACVEAELKKNIPSKKAD